MHLLLQNQLGCVIISSDISLGDQRRSEGVVGGDFEGLMMNQRESRLKASGVVMIQTWQSFKR